MPRYVALLRGINVGGHKRVPMAELRALLEARGYTDVATLLQSGNVALSGRERSADGLARTLEGALAERFGFPVPVLVRTRDELAAVVSANPLPGAEEAPSRFLVTFLSAPLGPERLAALSAEACPPDALGAVGRELYARFPLGMRDSKLAAALLDGKRLGVTATARNWATVTRLLALADG
jgi:uncharacterized protein (DUF1697 family)